MKKLLFLLFLGLFTSCQNTKHENKEITERQSEKVEIKNTTDKSSFKIKSNPDFDLDKLSYDGDIVFKRFWQDSNGENIALFSKKNHELFVHVFSVQSDSVRLLRRVYDFSEKDCDADLIVTFIERSITVTDLDNNNLGEITFAYNLACISDVSPLVQKLLILEDGDKYIIRGETLLRMGNQTSGGQKNIDPSFNQGPVVFEEYANEMWDYIQNPDAKKPSTADRTDETKESAPAETRDTEAATTNAGVDLKLTNADQKVLNTYVNIMSVFGGSLIMGFDPAVSAEDKDNFRESFSNLGNEETTAEVDQRIASLPKEWFKELDGLTNSMDSTMNYIQKEYPSDFVTFLRYEGMQELMAITTRYPLPEAFKPLSENLSNKEIRRYIVKVAANGKNPDAKNDDLTMKTFAELLEAFTKVGQEMQTDPTLSETVKNIMKNQ